MTDTLINIDESDRDGFGSRNTVARHTLQESNLFSDDYLVGLLDRHPREHLQAFTMGTDPRERDDWASVDTGDLSGQELYSAVQRGRLWINVLKAHEDPGFAEIVSQLQAELKDQCPTSSLHDIKFGTLLISSPGAMVYYHLDTVHQALWHIRGHKKVWIYPPEDKRFTPQEDLEDLFAGTYDYDEELPYEMEFDDHAEVFDLNPGEFVVWPFVAPHRVQNRDDLNVSLVTGFETPESERRSLIYNFNWLTREYLGRRNRSISGNGLLAEIKCFVYRVYRRVFGTMERHREGPKARYRVDPSAPLGVTPLDPTA